MTQKTLSIDDLFSDSGAFDEATVVKAIQPFVTIQKSSNQIFFKTSSLTTERSILVYGLAKKLLKHKVLIESELITANEIHKNAGLKKGSVDPAFKKLKETGFLVGKREYEIPLSQISRVLEALSKE